MVNISDVDKRSHELVDKPVRLMGIVNVTPDSFSDGGTYFGPQAAIEHAHQLVEEGADLIDIGGESTRPGANLVTLDEELQRVIPVIEGLQGSIKAPISIDTRKAEVMRQALEAGAQIINDVSALQYDNAALSLAAKSNCMVILMHGKGDPATMQDNPNYKDVVAEVYDYLAKRIAACELAGMDRSRLVIDPGIGFGKTLDHNLSLLANLDQFHDLGVPLMLGASRKRFIGSLAAEDDPCKRVSGSIAAALAGVSKGVQFLRVHDVKETHQALMIWQAIEGQGGTSLQKTSKPAAP